MPSTYTDNVGIEKPGTGDLSGTWGVTDNRNYDIIDQAITGAASVVLPATGSTGTPNDLDIPDGTLANGRSPYINVTDGGDLGATAYLRITPNDHKKIGWFKNSLSGSRSLIIFQGTYNAANDHVLAAGETALLRFDGGGVGAIVTPLVASSAGVYVTDGDKGDITVSGTGTIWTIDNDAVTFAKMKNATASSKLVGSGASGAGADYVELTLGTNLSMSGTTLNASGGGSDNALTAAPGSDHTVSGLTVTLQTSEACAFGDVMCMGSDGQLDLADADVSTDRVICMATETLGISASGVFLLFGIARDDTWAWTVGSPIYNSSTNGGMTQTAPATTGQRVQIMGYATHADRMLFNPSPDWIIL